MKRENRFQRELISSIKKRFPKSVVLKNDANYIQGIPDLLVLNGRNWAMLEVKRSSNASHRMNQDYYISKFNDMSFAAFVSPENKEDILDELDRAFQTEGAACAAQPE